MPLYTGHCPRTTPHVIAVLTQHLDNALAGMAETVPQLAKLLTMLLKQPSAVSCVNIASAPCPNVANCWSCQMSNTGHPRRIMLRPP